MSTYNRLKTALKKKESPVDRKLIIAVLRIVNAFGFPSGPDPAYDSSTDLTGCKCLKYRGRDLPESYWCKYCMGPNRPYWCNDCLGYTFAEYCPKCGVCILDDKELSKRHDQPKQKKSAINYRIPFVYLSMVEYYCGLYPPDPRICEPAFQLEDFGQLLFLDTFSSICFVKQDSLITGTCNISDASSKFATTIRPRILTKKELLNSYKNYTLEQIDVANWVTIKCLKKTTSEAFKKDKYVLCLLGVMCVIDSYDRCLKALQSLQPHIVLHNLNPIQKLD